MVFYLSGMQGIDDSIYESAQIDGASAFARFRYITLPMLGFLIILFTTINLTIGTLQLFDEVVNITDAVLPANANTIIYHSTFTMNV